MAVVTAVDPNGPDQGDTLRLRGLMAGARQMADSVDVWWTGQRSSPIQAHGLRVRIGHVRRTGSLYLGRVQEKWSGSGYYDVVLGFQLRMAPVALEVPARYHILDLTDSLDLYQSRLPWTLASLRTKLGLLGANRAETYYGERFDQVWVSAEPDAAWLRRQGISSVVVPNGVRSRALLAPGDPKQLLFVGNLAYLPNRHGLVRFLHTVWPALFRQGFRLNLVGNRSERYRGPGVTGYGFVRDILPYYRNAGIAVSPVLWGAGSQNKILEAMSFGRPVVVSSRAALGLPPKARHAALMADRPDAWAKALASLQNGATYNEHACLGFDAVQIWGEASAQALQRFLVVRLREWQP